MGNSACTDTLTVTGTAIPMNALPVVCGQNDGQHMYVEVGPADASTATLAFVFMNAAAAGGAMMMNPNRNFEIRVTQLECNSPVRPPPGCLQYPLGMTGMFQTFNFANAMSAHLQNQRYNICIRKNEGFCCVKYSECTLTMGQATAFSIFRNVAAQVDSQCTLDYVTIAGGSEACGAQMTFNRFCGDFLGTSAQKASGCICQCTNSFEVGITTDAAAMEAGAGQNRGVCLNYNQVAC